MERPEHLPNTTRDGRHRFFIAEDGVVLHAFSRSSRIRHSPLPLLLLVHGFGGNAGHWTGVLESLSADVDCVIPELRGHGRSGWSTPSRYAVEWLSRDILKLIEGLDRDVILVGHSLGGEAALSAAVRSRAIRGLVLIDVNPDLSGEVAEWIRTSVVALLRPFRKIEELAAELEGVFPLASADVLSEVARLSLREERGDALELLLDPAVTAKASPIWDPARRAERSAAMWSALRELDIPVLMVRGRVSSVLSPDTVAKMAATAAHADHITLDGGHSVLLDNPEGVSTKIRDFVARTAGFVPCHAPPTRTEANDGTC
jgi:pimeloyl-ACP methyl ester carboxylesterase